MFAFLTCDGEKEALWLDAVARSKRPLVQDEPKKDRTDRDRLESRVLAALRLGDVRKALQMLNSAPIAPKTKATLERLQKLHPSGDNPTEDVVRAALSSFGPSSAAGLFGYKPLLLQQCARAESFVFVRALTTAVNDFASGRAPDFLKPFVAGGVSIALEKTETSVRPLACGDPLRRLVAKCFCIACKEDISLAFKGRNYGVGCPGGVEVVAHSLRDTLETHKGSKLGLLKIDFRNAFNEIKRDHFVTKVSELFPPMSNWTQWCYGEASMLLYDHEHVIWSRAGVQQGDPLGPLYFCCGINGLVNEIAALNPVYNKWYMDDGGIVGGVELLKKVWEILKTRGPALGLHLNPSKCEWSWLDPECASPCPIRLEGVSKENQVKLVPHREIQMLGVPLGDDAFVSGFVEKRLIGKLFDTIDKLVNFEDSQAASYLLRVSYSIVRAVHFMRTTPFYQWEKQGEKFDNMVRGAAEKILGCSMSERVCTGCVDPKARWPWPAQVRRARRLRLQRQLARVQEAVW
jgi:reverse transcriptase-like protein